MTIKTIHLPILTFSGDVDPAAADYAAALAGAHGAQLIVTIGATRPYHVFPEGGAAAEAALAAMAASVYEQAQESAEALRAKATAHGAGVETETLQGSTATLLLELAERSRAVDLVVASLAGADTPFSESRQIAEELLLAAGRPVLITPPDATFQAEPALAVVAWDGGPKAARAVGDALPFLKRATSVVVATVDAAGETSIDTTRLEAHLSRHGVAVEIARLPLGVRSIGATIDAYAKDMDADLLVAGAYGHSRLREFIFGGVTKHFLADASCPTLMSF